MERRGCPSGAVEFFCKLFYRIPVSHEHVVEILYQFAKQEQSLPVLSSSG